MVWDVLTNEVVFDLTAEGLHRQEEYGTWQPTHHDIIMRGLVVVIYAPNLSRLAYFNFSLLYMTNVKS